MEPFSNSGVFSQTGSLTQSANMTNGSTATTGGAQNWYNGGNKIALGGSAHIQSTAVQLPEPEAIGILVLGTEALARRKRKTLTIQ